MKNILKILTIAGLVLAVTLALASCDDGKKSTPMMPSGSKWKAPAAFANPAPAFTSVETASTALSWTAVENPPKEAETTLLQSYAVLSYKKGSDRTLGTVTVTASTTASVGIPLEETHVYELYAIYKNKLADPVPDVGNFTKLDAHKEKAKFKDNKEASINYPTFTVPTVTTADGSGAGKVDVTWGNPTTIAPGGWKLVGVGIANTAESADADPGDSQTFTSAKWGTAGAALENTVTKEVDYAMTGTKDIWLIFVFDYPTATTPTYAALSNVGSTYADFKTKPNVKLVKLSSVVAPS